MENEAFSYCFTAIGIGWIAFVSSVLPAYLHNGAHLGDSIVSIQLANLTAAFPTNPRGYNNYTALDNDQPDGGSALQITIVNNPTFTSGSRSGLTTTKT